MKLPTINDGFFEGQAQTPLPKAEEKRGVKSRTPQEKAEFRKAYWRGRIHSTWSFDLSGCIQYLTTKQLKTLHGRLDALFMETLVDMYGEQGAREFIKNTTIERKEE